MEEQRWVYCENGKISYSLSRKREFPIVKDTTPNMMNPRLNITSKQNTGCSNQIIACIRCFAA